MRSRSGDHALSPQLINAVPGETANAKIDQRSGRRCLSTCIPTNYIAINQDILLSVHGSATPAKRAYDRRLGEEPDGSQKTITSAEGQGAESSGTERTGTA